MGLIRSFALTVPLNCAISLATFAGERTFHVGEEWTLKDSPSPETRVIVGKIEPFGDSSVCHISVVEVPVPKEVPLGREVTEIGHLPIACASLDISVDTLVGENRTAPETFEEGYEIWSDAKGGMFTVNVPQAIELIFRSIRSKLPELNQSQNP